MSRRRVPWLGGAVLVLCYGFAVVMVTGDWGKGAGIFCLVALVFALLMLLLGHRAASTRTRGAHQIPLGSEG